MDERDSQAYVLSNKCLNESDKENGIHIENDKYITCKESGMCWYIENINMQSLILRFMGRGNTIKYKKVNIKY